MGYAMKICITIEVDANDLDWSESSLHGWKEDGAQFWEIDAIAKYNGIPVEDMDYDKADEYLIERHKERTLQ